MRGRRPPAFSGPSPPCLFGIACCPRCGAVAPLPLRGSRPTCMRAPAVDAGQAEVNDAERLHLALEADGGDAGGILG
eukprot:5113116-Prymnesium_polylepis.1